MIMSDLYTTKTAALKATKADIVKLKTNNFYINDSKITEDDIGFSLPRDYPKLIPDCDFSISEDYMIYDENGVVEHMSFADKIETGYYMFQYDTNIKKFEIDMSNLKYGYGMFCNSDIEKFKSNMYYLENASSMFYNCRNLSSFETYPAPSNIDNQYCLQNLTDAYDMFVGTNISEIHLEMPSCSNAAGSFSRCPSLTSVYTSLADNCNCYNMFANSINLKEVAIGGGTIDNAERMFDNCCNLSHFNCQTSVLSNLNTYSYGMFRGCILDSDSVELILTGLRTVSSGDIYLGISNSAANTFNTMTGLLPSTNESTVNYKGWTITVKIND